MSENHALSLALAARLLAAVRLPGGLVITESVSLKPLWRAGITACLVIALAACGGAGADSGNPDPAQSSVVSAPADGAGAQTPAVPVGLAATSGDSQIALGWTASAGAASYNVKRSTTSGGPYTIIASPMSPSYTDTALTNGDTYYYVVSAVNSAGESPNSSQVQGTPAAAAQPPAAPTGLVATAGETQVALAWAASADAAGYRVKRGTSSGGPYTTIASPTTSSYTDTGLTNGTTYYYVVSATNSAGESPDSSEARATPAAAVRPPSAPTGLIATGGNAQIALTWSGSASATSYHVKRATTSGGPYTTVSSPTGASYTDTGLMNGTTYYYVISAVNSAGESANSSEARATPSAPLPVPGTPIGLAATAGDARVSLTWSASANAATYNVKRSTHSGGPYTTVASPTSSSYTDTGLTNGTIYYYVVSAANGSGESANSSQVSAKPAAAVQIPGVPNGLAATPGDTQVVLSWNTSSGATSYHLKRSTASGGSYTTIASPTGTSYSDTGLTDGTTYYYVVSALDAAGESANSAAVSATPSAAGGGGGGGGGGNSLIVRTSGNHLVDGNGSVLQLRGVNVSGFEFFSVQGYDASQTLETQTGSASPWTAIKSWGANAVRLPLNETSWNANDSASVTCTDVGTKSNPDPLGNYRTSVKAAVDAATAAGLYVILDLHWSAPANFCALAENPIGNMTNTPTFWTSVATTFKSYPNVIFDVFNEPYADDAGDFGDTDDQQWTFWRDGGSLTQYVSSQGDENYSYKAAGVQTLINTVRATGATNVIILGVMSWGCDMGGALTHMPTDPLNQLAISYHAYPASNDGGAHDSTPVQAMCGAEQLSTYAPAILAAGVPLVIGEFGDQMANNNAPFLHTLLPWADANNVSYLGWTWDTWGPSTTNPYLIADGNGTPATPGFATYTKAHFLCRAAGGNSCP